ncbi:MAG: VWA containing CoxE family protein, partial [Pseudomonadota bacterium]|nr:VWA containing CoxE family protein [Pseudomonadota bacterium]
MATRPLEDFIRALRDAEVRVSVAETLDAHRVVGLLGFQDRAVTKDALAVTLAKSADEKTRFDDVFERFFSRDLPAAPDDAAAETANAPVPAGATPESATDGDAGDAGDGRAPADLADMLMAGDQAGLAAAMEAAAAA